MSEMVQQESSKVNRIGLTRNDYKGGKSTLCPGCGHDAITGHLIAAYYEMGVTPHEVVKLSGIGCSSKTPAYFIQQGHGFNGVHGRMPSVATGCMVANHKLHAVGVSGDGDTASIGMGQFCHMMRRNVPMLYIIENNGVYGLTKGQFSATADLGSVQKKGSVNEFEPIDCCAVAITLGATFVARSFSGDGKQLIPLVKAAIAHNGTALLDIISPCVTFNNHEGSTKSYTYVKDHDTKLHEVGFVPSYENIEVDYAPGSSTAVKLHDGSQVVLKKLGEDYNPRNRLAALGAINKAREHGQIVTGLLYVDTERKSYPDFLDLVDAPLASLKVEDIRPGREALSAIMDALT